MNVVKLPAHVDPACGLFDRMIRILVVVEAVKSGITIGLQDPDEVLQMLARVLALAIRGVGEPDRRRIGAARRSIITNVAPQAALPGRPSARTEHGYRGIVAVNLVGIEHVVPDRCYQRIEKGGSVFSANQQNSAFGSLAVLRKATLNDCFILDYIATLATSHPGLLPPRHVAMNSPRITVEPQMYYSQTACATAFFSCRTRTSPI